MSDFQPFRSSSTPRPADPVRSPTDMNVPEGWLSVGKITSPQGLKGEVRVYPDSDFPQRFLDPGQRWLLGPGDSEPRTVELVSGRYMDGKGLYVLQFAGISDRNQAEALRGALILVPEDDRPPLEPGEFHLLDLIGLPVINQATQTQVGTVISVVPAGNDLLEVETLDRQKVLVPLVQEIVPVVDLENQRIEINPPPGLFP